MKPDESRESGNVHSLAMAVTLAMLGVSVGVDVHKVWAESLPGGAPTKNQPTIDRSAIKFDSKEGMRLKEESVQSKVDATQQKLPSRQFKERMRPGVKPVDPPR
jgi:hypothetical protein